MNLVIDVGNTHVVIGVFKNRTLRHCWRLNTKKTATADELVLLLNGLLGQPANKQPQMKAIALASVVPSVLVPWKTALKNYTQIKPYIVHAENCNTFNIDYRHPEQVGADRLCNVLACQALQIPEAIVIDFGTATTFDIYKDKTYLGGVICPGILTSLKALVRGASRLAEVTLSWNDNIIGKNTDDALRNGMLYGTLAQIEGLIDIISTESNMGQPAIIATGGLASLVSKKSTKIHRVEKDLTLIGLNHFIELHNKEEHKP